MGFLRFFRSVGRSVVDTAAPGVGRRLRRFRDARQVSGLPVTTPHGFRLCGNARMQCGAFEPEETELFKEMVPGYDLFINVGANIGYYCCMALKAGVDAVAFEPIDLNLVALTKNVVANGWEHRIELFPMAVSDRHGVMKIYGGGLGASLLPDWSNNAPGNFGWVPVTTLDATVGARLAGRRCLVLIDVEGAERSVLAGARSLLAAEPRPTWIVEICVDEHQPPGVAINPRLEETFETFWRAGYRAQTFSRTPRDVTESAIARVLHEQLNSLGTHNFIFRPHPA